MHQVIRRSIGSTDQCEQIFYYLWQEVPATVKSKIKEVLGVEKEGGEGNYLGLPECFSGSKSQMLSFVQEKLQGRVNGWFTKALSTGGKEILVKSIGLAMPIFAMSCFKLPKNLCEKITSTLIQFGVMEQIVRKSHGCLGRRCARKRRKAA